jgi:hypothetical protein
MFTDENFAMAIAGILLTAFLKLQYDFNNRMTLALEHLTICYEAHNGRGIEIKQEVGCIKRMLVRLSERLKIVDE